VEEEVVEEEVVEAVEDHPLPDHHNMHKDSMSYLQQATSK
jgi:tetraacyldisaccharide-1-P 4'-kinase